MLVQDYNLTKTGLSLEPLQKGLTDGMEASFGLLDAVSWCSEPFHVEIGDQPCAAGIYQEYCATSVLPPPPSHNVSITQHHEQEKVVEYLEVLLTEENVREGCFDALYGRCAFVRYCGILPAYSLITENHT